MPKIRLTSICCLALSALASAAVPFDKLDIPHPRCQVNADIDVADEYFVEVANKLPGVVDYNGLIRIYRSKNWKALDGAMAAFDQTHESSPLREAVTFLRAQSLWERITDPNGNDVVKADRAMREATLLYPSSTIAPIVLSTAASFYLSAEKPQKSLALFGTLREQYPVHEMSCVFTFGFAEAAMQAADEKSAESALEVLLQKCQNPRLRLGAEIRLRELRIARGENEANIEIEKLVRNQAAFTSRYYPATLYNLGEYQFAKGNYPTAKFYFKEFMKADPPKASCMAYARKRMADIALRRNEPKDSVIGQYLDVKEKGNGQDAARFSYVRALLLGMNDVREAERTRRIRVIDDEIEKIKDPAIRDEIYVEKGMASLEQGDSDAVTYLLRLHGKHALEKKALGPYLRKQILAQLNDTEGSLAPGLQEAYEQAFETWFTGEKEESAFRVGFHQWMARRLEKSASEVESGFTLLDSWAASPIWKEGTIPEKTSRQVEGLLLKSILTKSAEPALSFASQAKKKRDTIVKILGPKRNSLWVVVATTTKDTVMLQSLLKGKTSRELTSTEGQMPDEVESEYRLAKSDGLTLIGSSGEAEKSLAKVGKQGLKQSVLERQVTLHRKAKRFGKAFTAAKELVDLSTTERSLANLNEAREIVLEGKLWKQAVPLFRLAEKKGVAGKDLAPFRYLAGKASFEATKCNDAISNYEEALKLDPEYSAAGEAMYRIGKCFWLKKNQVEAKRIWSQLSSSPDSFWSQLAKNELKLISK